MRNSRNAMTEARRKFLDENVGYDYIMETRELGDCTEFITSMGGDVARYRVYGDKPDEFKVYCK